MPRLTRSAVALLAAGILLGALSVQPAAGGTPPAAEPALAPPPAPADVLVDGRGDEHGYHLYKATAGDDWRWRPLATLEPGGFADDTWVGNHCLTGDGRSLVAVVSPWRLTNRPEGRDRGAVAYAVNLSSGRVRPLVTGVALKYYTPGCGAGSQVALTRHLGSDEAASEVLVVNSATADVTSRFATSGHLTSAVPVEDGVIGAMGSAIVRFRPGKAMAHVGQVPGRPYQLRATTGGVDLLVADDTETARIWRLDGTSLARVGSGRLADLNLFSGRGGRTTVIGAEELRGGLPGMRTARFTGATQPRGASLDGTVVLGAEAARDRLPDPTLHPAGSGAGAARPLPRSTKPAVTDLPPSASGTGTDGARTATALAANFTTPKCAVPRNDQLRQVPQPNPARIDWALQLAARGKLNITRPANFLNMGLAAYTPSGDFGQIPLTGATGTPIPRSVIEGIFAQESNFKHASWHAIPGVAGNPLISDYYGANGGVSSIDFDQADCGYGVGQVTDGMTAASTKYTANGKTKIALDYAENVAAAIQILAGKWNELRAANIVANNGDPTALENWYFAVWAYNSGLYPNTGGPWGLGWTNNPMNADYPANRAPFLRNTYADAAEPWKWPYQEKVFGWMETPILIGGQRAYVSSGYLTIPRRDTFCVMARNECNPSYIDPNPAPPDQSYCTRADRKCWWHDSVTWIPQCASGPAVGGCVRVSFTVAEGSAEPPLTNPHPPGCAPGSDLPVGAVIVDDQSTNYNVVGCNSGSGKGWTSQGSFLLTFGKDAAGAPIGKIDFHQLGAGFGGHFWFTYNYPSTDTPHIDVGTWTPPASVTGPQEIWAFIPGTGNTTNYARYKIYPGDGSVRVTEINQHRHVDPGRWVSLGVFVLQAGAKVTLSNVTGDTTTGNSVAMDALAFIRAAAPPAQKFVALGDSYSAGEGVAPYLSGSNTATNQCHRSMEAYATRIKPRGYPATFLDYSRGVPGIGWGFVACSGARLPNVPRLGDNGAVVPYVQATSDGKTQLDMNVVDRSTTLVALTIGGNDVDWANVLTQCAGGACDLIPGYRDTVIRNIDELRGPLEHVFNAVKREAAPGAKIVAMGYPNLLPSNIVTSICPFAAPWVGQEAWFRARAVQLNGVIAQAAAATGINFVPVASHFDGHEQCGGQAEWILGPLGGNGAYHPNETGQREYARLLQQWVDSH